MKHNWRKCWERDALICVRCHELYPAPGYRGSRDRDFLHFPPERCSLWKWMVHTFYGTPPEETPPAFYPSYRAVP